jgi:hypothetical protein
MVPVGELGLGVVVRKGISVEREGVVSIACELHPESRKRRVESTR